MLRSAIAYSEKLWRKAAISAFVFLSMVGMPQSGSAQTTTNPLTFQNNYFVTGDYVVSGWAGKTASTRPGYATGTISFPDSNQMNVVPAQAHVTYTVPAGADIVAAVLYYQTVEKSSSALAGQIGFFNGKQFAAGLVLNNQPPNWSAGGCSGPSNGTTIVQTYRADVRPYLPVASGVIQPNGPFTVELADSGSNGSGTPFTLGATLVIVYRVLSQDYPMNAIIFFDGSYAPNTTAPNMLQNIWGFYAPAAIPVAKLTHIVGNGQANKLETVSFNSQQLDSLYSLGTSKGNPPFPGVYNGAWDNPTWDVSAWVNNGTLFAPDGTKPGVPAVTTEVDSGSTNRGCVSWGAVVFSTTVDQNDNDGLLTVWKKNVNPANNTLTPGYCDAGVNNGQCTVGGTGWVDLAGAHDGQQDVFIQADTMCTTVTGGQYAGSCSVSTGTCGYSGCYGPPPDALNLVLSTFSTKGSINVRWVAGNYIQAPACTDSSLSSGQLCMYPTTNTNSQPGVVPWKAGLIGIKNMPLNYSTEQDCENAPTTKPCVRIFQRGRKDSYHYLLFANRLGAPRWTFAAGTLTGMSWDASTLKVTFTTSTDASVLNSSSQTGYDRVTIAGSISNPAINGTYKVTPGGANGFSIQLPSAPTLPWSTVSSTSDPNLVVYTGNAGTGSGMSDIGGSDTLISLGGWNLTGAAAVNPYAGTIMHELGHTLGLTHGGYSYPNHLAFQNYVPAIEPNCKPNYQSVMSYLFQVDLLGATDGSRVLDYSSLMLGNLDTTGSGSAATWGSPTYLGTRWFALSTDNPVGTPATRHCDGTPKGNSPDMVQLEGLVSQFTWATGQDVNYDGFGTQVLGGFNDWAQGGDPSVGHMDLRQVGATGSASSAAGFNLGTGGGFNLGTGGGFNLGTGGGFNLGTGGGFNLGTGGGFNLGSGGGFNLGTGGGFNLGTGGGEDRGEINFDVANSYVRPPRFFAAALAGTKSTQVALSWKVPTFGAIDHYIVYRKASTETTFSKLNPATPITGTSFTDTTSAGCTTYTYFVTATIADGTAFRESVPSNPQTITTACTFIGFATPLQTAGPTSYSGAYNLGKTIGIAWQLQDPTPPTPKFVNTLSFNKLGYKIVPGGVPASGKCAGPGNVTPGGFTQILSPITYDSKKNQFNYSWNTTGLPAGCYILEVDIPFNLSPQAKANATTVLLK
jgi:hypothetical protein